MHPSNLTKAVIGSLLSFAAVAANGASANKTGAEQTPQGAQQFIKQLAEKRALTIEVEHPTWGWNTGGLITTVGSNSRRVTMTHTFPPDPVRSASSDNKCETVLDYNQPGAVPSKPPGYGSIGYPLLINDKTIRWRTVTEVSQERNSIVWTDRRVKWRINVASEDLAARLAYAMEFLRIACDDTAGTGF